MSKIIIGLGSRAKIGKDYACAQLSKKFDVERIAFADKLKNDLVKIAYQYGIDFTEADEDEKIKERLRPLYVMYGQTMRIFDENVWVDAALRGKVLRHQLTIITDVRFPNEVKRLHELGGIYVEIKTNKPPANETEAFYSPQMEVLADYQITNNFDEKFVGDMTKLIKNLLKLGSSDSNQTIGVK